MSDSHQNLTRVLSGSSQPKLYHPLICFSGHLALTGHFGMIKDNQFLWSPSCYYMHVLCIGRVTLHETRIPT